MCLLIKLFRKFYYLIIVKIALRNYYDNFFKKRANIGKCNLSKIQNLAFTFRKNSVDLILNFLLLCFMIRNVVTSHHSGC